MARDQSGQTLHGSRQGVRDHEVLAVPHGDDDRQFAVDELFNVGQLEPVGAPDEADIAGKDKAERLVRAHALREKEDIFYLTFQELHTVAATDQVDEQLIRQRKDAFTSYQALTPPRVLTSDGEVVTGSYRREDVPAGALVG